MDNSGMKERNNGRRSGLTTATVCTHQGRNPVRDCAAHEDPRMLYLAYVVRSEEKESMYCRSSPVQPGNPEGLSTVLSRSRPYPHLRSGGSGEVSPTSATLHPTPVVESELSGAMRYLPPELVYALFTTSRLGCANGLDSTIPFGTVFGESG